jgi:predicted ATPase
MQNSLDKITIKGFKSIQNLEDFELKNLNVLIGGNGAGKSNFIQLFKMLGAMTKQNFSKFISEHGGADSFLFNGPKVTPKIDAEFEFNSGSPYSQGSNHYKFELFLTADEKFVISEERKYMENSWRSYGSPSEESRLKDEKDEAAAVGRGHGVGYYVYNAISKWMVYHFHDTSDNAPMRRNTGLEDYHLFRNDAANIAPFLYHLKTTENYKTYYDYIVNAVRLVNPFFDDFRLDVMNFGAAEKVRLSWQQKGSDYPMQPYHLSDGSIRFICLATALLQPNPPSVIVIDEPELGLHPGAIAILAELIQDASNRTQVIVATQSPTLINYFSIDDIVVVNRKDGQSTFERLKEEDYNIWLEDYSVGELWTKNVIAGGPTYE